MVLCFYVTRKLPRAIIGVQVVAFIHVDPSRAHRWAARGGTRPSLGHLESHALAVEERQFLLSRFYHQGILEKLARQVVGALA